MGPIKVNVVVKRGVNDHDIVALARHFHGTPYVPRFIEFMDVGNTNGWRMDDVVPSREVIERIDAALPLEPVAPRYAGEVATRWRYRDGGGEIGVISSVTAPFCHTCTRVRISTEGKLFTCLFADQGHDLRAMMRSGCTDEELTEAMSSIWRRRTDRYSEIRSSLTEELRRSAKHVEMSYIGG
jgi:cyclic pyranopterin phosphate synthase